jgi:hypothetical protein
MGKSLKFNKHRALNKDEGLGKNQKLINVGPMFILDYRVYSNSNLFGLKSQ